jgi:hypothetical protein
MITYDIDNIDSCPICESKLEYKDIPDNPEWYWVCPKGHFKIYEAFWGSIVYINDRQFKVPSVNNEKEMNKVNDYLDSVREDLIK